MFRIGEFSTIARVSGRLLRYYDELGLLRPQRIDPETGYRWYSASQLPRLNRILALKDLGMTLEQVARLVDDGIPAAELRGMLLLRRAELEQSLAAGQARLRHIESRLQQIDEEGALTDYDIIVKPLPAQPYLALRGVYAGMEAVFATLRMVTQAVVARVAEPARGRPIVIAHSDFDEEELDLEIGFGLTRDHQRPLVLPDRRALSLSELPACPIAATVARGGPAHQAHLAFGAMGRWMEANGYRIAGPCREVFLEVPFQAPSQPDPVIEIQFPVTKAA